MSHKKKKSSIIALTLMLAYFAIMACTPDAEPTPQSVSISPDALQTVVSAPEQYGASDPVPPPAWIEEVAPIIPLIPHPQGLDGCKAFNLFSAGIDEVAYRTWCAQEASNSMKSKCKGTGSSQDEQECAKSYLVDWEDYEIRTLLPCAAISDPVDANECSVIDERLGVMQQLWKETHYVIIEKEEVRQALSKVYQCLSDPSFQTPPKFLDLSWQEFRLVHAFGSPSFQQNVDQDLLDRTFGPSDDCAQQADLYIAQDAAWLAEVKRLVKEEPVKAQPFLDWRILTVLEEPGVAPFLTPSDVARIIPVLNRECVEVKRQRRKQKVDNR